MSHHDELESICNDIGLKKPQSVEEISINLLDADSYLEENPNNARSLMYALCTYLYYKEPMPHELQDRLLKALAKSIRSEGEISIDQAIGITKYGKKKNIYQKHNSEELLDKNLYFIQILVEFFGLEKAISARLVAASGDNKYTDSALERYYRDYSEQVDENLRGLYKDPEFAKEFLERFITEDIAPADLEILKKLIDEF